MSGRKRRAEIEADASLRSPFAVEIDQARCACAKLRAQLKQAHCELQDAREQIGELLQAHRACEAASARLSYITRRSIEGRQAMWSMLVELGLSLKQLQEGAKNQNLDFDISFTKRVVPISIDSASLGSGSPDLAKEKAVCQPDTASEVTPVCAHLYVHSDNRSQYCPMAPSWVCMCPQCDKASHANRRLYCCAEHFKSVSDLHLRSFGIFARWAYTGRLPP